MSRRRNGLYRRNSEEAKDVYICPEGIELGYRNTAVHHGKRMRIYKSMECIDCGVKHLCTRNKKVLNISGPERLIGVMEAINKGIYDKFGYIFVNMLYFYTKIKSLALQWLKLWKKEVVYA